MKYTRWWPVLSISVLFLVACQNPASKIDLPADPRMLEQKALVLASNLAAVAEAFPKSQDVASEVSPAQYFTKLTILDGAGNPLEFAQLTDVERKSLMAFWIQDSAKEWAALAAADPYFAVELEAQSDAVDHAFAVAHFGKLSPATYKSYFDDFQTSLEALRKVGKSKLRLGEQQRSATGEARGVAWNNPTAQAILANIKANFKPGRVLIYSGGTSPSSSGSGSANYLGHSAIMNSLSDTDRANPRADQIYANMTSWGANSPWSGLYGVQREPLSEWNNTVVGLDGAGSTIKVKSVVRSAMVLEWFGWHWVFTEATNAEHAAAAAYAVSKTGSGYNFDFILGKANTSWFYCSSLVWRSWKNQDSDDLDLDWSWWDSSVPPSDLDGTNRTQLLYQGQN